MLLFAVLLNSYYKIIKFLLKKGVDIITINSYKRTLLNAALLNNYLKVVKFLLERGVDIIIANSNK